jgi:hypothetical protein
VGGKMECEECTVCCTLSVVPDFNKEVGEECIKCNNGCEIYGDHPQVCKDFECAYLQSKSNIELRPDKSGIMFFKKNEKIFVGILVPNVRVTELAKDQIKSFNMQGYSVVLLKIGEKPHIFLAKNHNFIDIYKEYWGMLEWQRIAQI